MTSKPVEPAYYPPPPPLLPRGMRPANPTMYAQGQAYYTQQMQSGAMMPQQQMREEMNRQVSPQSQPVTTAPTSATSPPDTATQLTTEEIEKRIDKTSIKGNFGWMTLDGVNIPCLFRNEEKYVAVRMVEQKLLSKYPSSYPDELRDRAPLMSQFITSAEAKLLNEINIEHCECEFGQQAFTQKDLIVAWPDFIEFYKIVKKHFPNENVADKQRKPHAVVSGGGGWVQINNTVVPYLKRLTPNAKETLRLAPLPVIKYAAGLLTDTEVPSLEPTEDECQQLSEMCQKAGLEFNFSKSNTQLVLLSMIQMYSGTNVTLKKLPDDDPFTSAEYCPDFELEDEKANSAAPAGVLLPTIQQLTSPPPYANQPPMGHPYMSMMDKRPPPNVTVQRSSTIVNNAQNAMYQTSMANRHQVNGHSQPGTSSPALHALEQMSVPPLKRQKMGNATSSATAPPQRTSPTQVNGNMLKNNHPGMGQPSFPQGMMLPYGSMPFGGPNARMLPPGMVPDAMAGWPGMSQNPPDMQQLSQMMNMQAAILSQTGHMGIPRAPMMPPPQGPRHQTVQRKAEVQHPAAQTKRGPPPRPSSTETTTKPAKKNKSILDTIQPIDFHGKKISCLVKDDTKKQFALIEAISRVYFPQCSLDEFINVMTNVLQISIYQLNRDEEKAFITFYGLPTESLKCNKVLNLQDLDQFMPQMKYMFKDKEQLGTTESRKAGEQPASVTQSTDISQSLAAANQDSNNNGAARSGAPTTNLPPPNPFKTNSYKPKSATMSKLSSKLEDAVNRLRQNKMQQQTSPVESNINQTEPELLPQAPVVPRNPFQSIPISSPPSANSPN